MDNKDFNEYLSDIKNIIKLGGNDTRVKRLINYLNLNCTTIDNNHDYFLECFNSDMTPEDAIFSLRDNEYQILRYIDDFSDDILIQEVKNRYISDNFVDDIDTEILEKELEDRYDRSRIKELSLDDLISKYTISEILCAILELNNTFSYSKEEIIEKLKKKM